MVQLVFPLRRLAGCVWVFGAGVGLVPACMCCLPSMVLCSISPNRDPNTDHTRDRAGRRVDIPQRRGACCPPPAPPIPWIPSPPPPPPPATLIEGRDVQTRSPCPTLLSRPQFEIETVADALAAYAHTSRRWIVLPLHSGLAIEDQDKVFAAAPPGLRKCIIGGLPPARARPAVLPPPVHIPPMPPLPTPHTRFAALTRLHGGFRKSLEPPGVPHIPAALWTW